MSDIIHHLNKLGRHIQSNGASVNELRTLEDAVEEIAALKKENEELRKRDQSMLHEALNKPLASCEVCGVTEIDDAIEERCGSCLAELEALRSRLSAYQEGIRPEDAKSPSDGLVYLVKLKSLNMMLLGMRDSNGVWTCAHPLITSGVHNYLDDEIETAVPLPQKEKS